MIYWRCNDSIRLRMVTIIGRVGEKLLLVLPYEFNGKEIKGQIASISEKYANRNEPCIGGYSIIENKEPLKALRQAERALFWARERKIQGIIGYEELGL